MFYEQINKLCKADGITPTKLERILKFGNGTIHNWDKCSPSLEKAILVAEYFGVGIDDMTSTNIPSKESRELAARFENYSTEQKNLIRCYMSLIEKGDRRGLPDGLIFVEGA